MLQLVSHTHQVSKVQRLKRHVVKTRPALDDGDGVVVKVRRTHEDEFFVVGGVGQLHPKQIGEQVLHGTWLLNHDVYVVKPLGSHTRSKVIGRLVPWNR